MESFDELRLARWGYEPPGGRPSPGDAPHCHPLPSLTGAGREVRGRFMEGLGKPPRDRASWRWHGILPARGGLLGGSSSRNGLLGRRLARLSQLDEFFGDFRGCRTRKSQ